MSFLNIWSSGQKRAGIVTQTPEKSKDFTAVSSLKFKVSRIKHNPQVYKGKVAALQVGKGLQGRHPTWRSAGASCDLRLTLCNYKQYCLIRLCRIAMQGFT